MKRILLVAAGLACLLGVVTPATAAPRAAQAAVALFEYAHDRSWLMDGAGLDHATQLRNNASQAYKVFSDGNGHWYFEESDNSARCLVHTALFVKTEDCSEWPNGKLFIPESFSTYWRFRAPGSTFVMAFREPPANGRTIYMAPGGKKGYGEAWYLDVLNHR